MSRPLADIDGEQVRKLAALGATYKEIGAFFGVSEKTIWNRFSAEKQQGEASGNLSLRRRQWKRAMEGSDVMLIHLGKNRLGQAEKQEISGSMKLIHHSYVEATIPTAPHVPVAPQNGGQDEEADR